MMIALFFLFLFYFVCVDTKMVADSYLERDFCGNSLSYFYFNVRIFMGTFPSRDVGSQRHIRLCEANDLTFPGAPRKYCTSCPATD